MPNLVLFPPDEEMIVRMTSWRVTRPTHILEEDMGLRMGGVSKTRRTVMKYRRGVTCQITAFEVPNPPLDPEATGRKWMAVATAHTYDPDVKVAGLKPEDVVATGEAMRVVSGRAFADTESAAMITALKVLLFQLTAKGYSANHDVELW